MLPTTKDRILDAGAEIIHQKGYNHTGIQEILSAANVPKGSFYNYFRNKEDFGLQIIDRFQCHFEQMAKDILEDTSIAPLNRIDRFLGSSIDHFQNGWLPHRQSGPGNGGLKPGVSPQAQGGHGYDGRRLYPCAG
jgi:AcrR family transcriptional regulator